MPGFELIGQEELAELEDLFARSRVLFRHGFDAQRNGVFKVREFERAFASHFQVPRALAVSSGTAALRVALAALGVGPGDEVITQSFTFVATVEAIVEAGAVPIVAEIDETLNMDPPDLSHKITKRTKAVIAVHMLGVPARLKEIQHILEPRGIPLIEDTAWGCGGMLEGRYLGTWGDVGTFSFDFAKVLTTGEGGMVVSRDATVHERAAAYHDHGHENNPAVPRWEDTRSGSGFNYRMTELQGAVGLAQLQKLERIVEGQRKNAAALRGALSDVPGLTWRAMPEGSFETADAVVFSVESKEAAGAVRRRLVEEGLGTKILPEAVTWHFAGTWTHIPQLVASARLPLGEAWPRSAALLSRCVALPVSVNMDPGIPERVRQAVGAVQACL